MPAYGLENNFSLIYALLDGVSRAWSAARAFTRAASIPIVSGCAPPNTRRAVRVISSSCRHGLAEIIERGAGVFVERLRVAPPHLEREFVTLSYDTLRHGDHFAQQSPGFFEAP